MLSDQQSVGSSSVLYSYCIPYDDGAAPNPYWGICTLAICKPVIRRTAEVGDWVVGTGSRNSPVGDTAGHVVYAMKVTLKMSMADYDQWTRQHLQTKTPAWRSSDHRRRLGDSIYDFSKGYPRLRRSVHGHGNVITDLGGRNVLLSDHFYYFGDHAIELPEDLLPIVKQGQGHRSWSNVPYADAFVGWLEGIGIARGNHGRPQLDLFKNETEAATCAHQKRLEAEEDEEVGEEPRPPSFGLPPVSGLPGT
jgi:hypothetical protein